MTFDYLWLECGCLHIYFESIRLHESKKTWTICLARNIKKTFFVSFKSIYQEQLFDIFDKFCVFYYIMVEKYKKKAIFSDFR